MFANFQLECQCIWLQLPTLPLAHIQVASITFPDVMQRATYCIRSFMFLIAVITFTFKIEAMFSFICVNIRQIFIFKKSFACFRIVGTERCSIVPIFLPENVLFLLHTCSLYLYTIQISKLTSLWGCVLIRYIEKTTINS